MTCRSLPYARSVLLAGALLSTSATASSLTSAAAMSPAATVSTQCFVQAGNRFNIDPLLLFAIAEVESKFDPTAKNQNRDGSVDYGLMQINSQHLPRLRARGVTAARLLAEPCLSVHVGAEILAGMIARHGYSWTAVGAYNAGGSAARGSARQRYAIKVWNRYRALVADRVDKSDTAGSRNSADNLGSVAPRNITKARKVSAGTKPGALGWQWRADDDLQAGLKALQPITSTKQETNNANQTGKSVRRESLRD